MKNSLEEIYKNKWDFIVYDVDGQRVISVVFFNSMFDTSKSFRLSKEESSFDFEQFKILSEKIRNQYEAYKEREIIPPISQI